MTGEQQIIIHVGLHKTGTTFLQERVFPALPDVRFVHPLHYAQPSDGPIERFLLELMFRNAACIDVARHRERINAWLAQLHERTVLISSEAIVGWPIENHSNLSINAEYLARVFPTAKIWLVVRRQDRWVESAYAQLLKAGFSTSIERYLNYRDGRFDRYNVGLYNGPNVDARDLNWDAFDRHYRERFGPDAVLTSPFELFTQDSAAFLRRFYAFAGIDADRSVFPDTRERVNERWSPLTAGVAKLVNKVPMPVKRAIRDRLGSEWHPSAVLARTLPASLLAGRTRALTPALGAALLELHRANNEALGRRIGLDLSAYGY
ncbi:hypothetical protein DB30_07308 [Enhygromyxa salina]|uniref:Sulfotransferase domain protein n=1 Tax=Enhygromyxa salina TaxID=215803 RepID=A0A0C2CS81_9BACT|nr:sulfotransferase [Enhygromyxa salina]KIG14041.1 hypothetical protein DB30_07308 [Enhygromyxa salina]